MRVLLVRHGQSDNNALKDQNTDDYYDRRQCDPDMSIAGREDTA